jgi:hypothetical protein
MRDLDIALNWDNVWWNSEQRKWYKSGSELDWSEFIIKQSKKYSCPLIDALQITIHGESKGLCTSNKGKGFAGQTALRAHMDKLHAGVSTKNAKRKKASEGGGDSRGISSDGGSGSRPTASVQGGGGKRSRSEIVAFTATTAVGGCSSDGTCLWGVQGTSLKPSSSSPQHVTIGDGSYDAINKHADHPNAADHKLVVHGRIYCTGVDNPSDERLKIELDSDGRSALAEICQIKIKRWLYKPEIATQLGLPAGVQLGPFAQELEKIIPEAVRVAGDLKLDVAVMDEKGNLVNEIKDFLVVDYQRLAVMNIEATQDINALTVLLQEQIGTVTSKVDDIDRRLTQKEVHDMGVGYRIDLLAAATEGSMQFQDVAFRFIGSAFAPVGAAGLFVILCVFWHSYLPRSLHFADVADHDIFRDLLFGTWKWEYPWGVPIFLMSSHVGILVQVWVVMANVWDPKIRGTPPPVIWGGGSIGARILGIYLVVPPFACMLFCLTMETIGMDWQELWVEYQTDAESRDVMRRGVIFILALCLIVAKLVSCTFSAEYDERVKRYWRYIFHGTLSQEEMRHLDALADGMIEEHV